jgi:hypothetical protein
MPDTVNGYDKRDSRSSRVLSGLELGRVCVLDYQVGVPEPLTYLADPSAPRLVESVMAFPRQSARIPALCFQIPGLLAKLNMVIDLSGRVAIEKKK